MAHYVLLVEDARNVALRIVTQLTQLGLMVSIVDHPDTAFTTACSTPPDVIIIERELAQDGAQRLCEWLKLDRRTAHIPIVLISPFYGTLDIFLRFAQVGVQPRPIKQHHVSLVHEVVQQLAMLPEYA
jgi:CheY-like chemotaxis protein